MIHTTFYRFFSPITDNLDRVIWWCLVRNRYYFPSVSIYGVTASCFGGVCVTLLFSSVFWVSGLTIHNCAFGFFFSIDRGRCAYTRIYIVYYILYKSLTYSRKSYSDYKKKRMQPVKGVQKVQISVSNMNLLLNRL